MLQQNSSPGGDQLRVSAASCSDTGLVRALNEDAILMYEPVNQAVSAQFGWLDLLADGDFELDVEILFAPLAEVNLLIVLGEAFDLDRHRVEARLDLQVILAALV